LNSRSCVLLFCLLFCVVDSVRATFTIDPAVLVLNVSAGETNGMVELENIGKEPRAVEFTIFERVLDLDGELDRNAKVKSNDFIIYPSEIILKPGEKASVQLRYAKKERLAVDKAYLLFSKEVLIPIGEDDEEEINIKVPVLVSYYTIVALETGKEGKLSFVSSKALGNNMVELIAENTGSGRFLVENIAIKTSTDIIKSFTGKKNSVMPGQRRRFTFKYMRPLTSKEVKFIYAPD
jgi:fimbrial chaperone protein